MTNLRGYLEARYLYTIIESPVGPILIAGDGESVRIIDFQEGTAPLDPPESWTRDDRSFSEAARQLGEYFAGRRRIFELPLQPVGTPFQRSVWAELERIPYGETISYGELARRIGKPRAMRAVGLANGANPLPIVIPCHRVIGANGKMVGYGAGLPIKRRLLALEAEHISVLFRSEAAATHR